MLQRRHVLVQGGLLALGGCGFRLRGSLALAFDSLYISAANASPIGNELRRSLESQGTVRIINDAALQSSAQAVLDIVSEAREKTVVGVTSTGQVREFSSSAQPSSQRQNIFVFVFSWTWISSPITGSQVALVEAGAGAAVI